MEADILRTLHEIKTILYVIGLVISIAAVFQIFEKVTLIIKNIKTAINEVWRNEASEYFEKGKYDSLMSHCEKRIETHPNDATAIWWLARANLANGLNDKADELFVKVIELEPTWKESLVTPYLKNDKSANKANAHGKI
jgi:tetratricopeptide (TPR) repeat protein